MKKTVHGWLILLLFFVSGATALVYEVVWSKFLAQMFGSTIQAQTIVLAVFMGGLALGNRIFGNRSDQLQRPIRSYGFLEIAIGIYACLFPAVYDVADAVFVRAGAPLLEHPWLLLILKAVLSVSLLLGPTVLMGGTLPLLAAWLQQNSPEAGRRSALFYAINSLGAVLGAALAGFFLVRALGMVATLQMTALFNVLVGVVALGCAGPRRNLPGRLTGVAEPNEDVSVGPQVRHVGWIVALTGGVSMGLEVLASRSLSLIFGSSLQSFAMVLIAFIFGIGLGAIAMAGSWTRHWPPQRLVPILLTAAAAWVGLLLYGIEQWVEFYRVAISGLGRTSVGYTFQQLLTALMALALLGVPAALLGSVLPLLMRSFANHHSSLGRQVGRLLTWNTLGAVTGVLMTGFILMPSFGLHSSFCLLALSLCVVAAVWARREQRRIEMRFSSAVATLVVGLMLFSSDDWRHVMSSGVFRARETEVNSSVMASRKKHIKIVFYEDAPDATVSVEHGDGIGAPSDVGLRINGKADASSRGDLCTQLLLGHLPLLARPESKEVFILGLGSGITAGAVLAHPIARLTVAENCEPVIRAAKFFDPWNRGVLTNDRVRIWSEDARTILKLSPQRYDVIVSQPSNPWMVGVGAVFSREFYQLTSRRLKDGGVMVQWFHLYDMHDGIVALVLRTFDSVFPFVEIWDSGSGDIIMLGSNEPWSNSLASYRQAFDRPSVQQDLQAIGITSPAALLGRQLASQRTGFAIPGEGPIQSDLFPILEYEAPRAFYMGRQSRMLGEFDERMAQRHTAPAEKRQLLANLPPEAVRRLFAQYSTINDRLAAELQRPRNVSASSSSVSGADSGHDRSAFESILGPVSPSSAPSSNQEVKQLLDACAQLEADPEQQRQGVEAIEGLLRGRTRSSDWSSAYYTALAVKTRLGMGQVQKAKQTLDLGLALEPDDEQLNYLARVLARDQQLNSSN